MIIIKDISELEKYKSVENVQEGVSYVTYEFKEGDKLCDVQFDVKVLPSMDCMFQNFYDEFELFDVENKNIDFNLYIIKCKNIIINDGCGVDYLYAENVTSRGKCFVEHLEATGDLTGEVFECDTIQCHNINAERVVCDNLHTNGRISVDTLVVNHFTGEYDLSAKTLGINGVLLNDVTARGEKD